PANCFQANHLVVSRIVGTGPAGSNDEFIELYNPTSNPITVTGYTLWYRAAANIGPWLAVHNIATLSGVVPSHRYLLAVYNAAGATYSFPAVPADVGYNPSISATGGQLLIWRTG